MANNNGNGSKQEKSREDLAKAAQASANKKSQNSKYTATLQRNTVAKWCATEVRNILSDMTYCGSLVQGRTTKPTFKCKKSKPVDKIKMDKSFFTIFFSLLYQIKVVFQAAKRKCFRYGRSRSGCLRQRASRHREAFLYR